MLKKFGIIFRSYAKVSELVDEITERAVISIEKAICTGAFDRICVAIPYDHDCGDTLRILRAKTAKKFPGFKAVDIMEFHGHHSCRALNNALGHLAFKDIDYAAIVSNKAATYLSDSSMRAVAQALAEGAKAVGLAVDELADIVKMGRIQNTFAVWDIGALRITGGFDSELGVEEIAPLVRLTRTYGPCIAVLEPTAGKLDVRQSADGRARHEEVMATKVALQMRECERLGADFEFIKSGIMPGYPRPI